MVLSLIRVLSAGTAFFCRGEVLGRLPLALFQLEDQKNGIYNILWALVFGFATLNILGLVAKRFEPTRRGLNLGELLAVMVVVVSILLLGWEMLYLFKVFPIRLGPR